MEILGGFFSVLLSCLAFAVLVHGQQQIGFISIDCGAPAGLSFTDPETGISYSSDGDYIDTGTNANISSVFRSDSLQQPLSDVRSFPEGNKNCYSLEPAGKRGTKYLIRAYFLYGNYDGKDELPEFDLYLGINLWYSVKFSNASDIVFTEIISVASSDVIPVCLINKGLGTPFISSLELRPLISPIYRASGSLVLQMRLDVGWTSSQTVRNRDDVYDRIWTPYTSSSWESFSTSSAIDGSRDTYYIPSTVMKTAVTPTNGSDTLEFSWNTSEPTLPIHFFMHFAEFEKLESNQSRIFNISWNGETIYGPALPRYLRTGTFYHIEPLTGPPHRITLYKTPGSTLPPILNAIEIYTLKQFSQSPTSSEDVDAITNIKASYRLQKNWAGDPCLPRNYSWEGLNCHYNGSNSPTIILLNLTSSGLTGGIAASLANLISMESLDLSSNNLTGPVPEFLSELQSLRFLSLEGNQLTGVVPTALLERSKDGSLTLSVDNQNLCALDSCKENKKDKKIIIPVVASVTSAVALLIVLIIVWRLKRRRQPDSAIISGYGGLSLASENHHFRYLEVVSITNNFQRAIGKGGFGTVYHGCLKDGTEVAVKMLSPSSSQGSMEFRTEVELLRRVHHRNVVSFVGYCDDGTDKVLIYEYMAKGNLQQNLSESNANALSWEWRLRIAIDAAQGLEYLHYHCKPGIIHRDVKSSNILLSEGLEAKVADFGLSKVFPSDDITHVSTTVKGTLGYLDPQYFFSQKLNEKSDVYSFGIVILELITCQVVVTKDSERIHIVQWVSPLLAGGEIRNIVDPRLQGDFDINSIRKAIEIAMECTKPTSIQRPTMSHVLRELKECLAIERARKGITSILNEDHLDTEPSIPIEMMLVDLESTTGPFPR